MDQRRNTNQHNRFRGVQVPQRPQPGPSTQKAIIPLLDERKSRPSRLARSLGWLRTKVTKRPKVSALIIIALLTTGYFNLPKDSETTTDKGTSTGQGTVTKLSRDETPKFSAILPAGKSIEDYGGWARISPSGNAPVFAYADKINNVPINVSQQELPANLKENTDANLEKLSHDFNAEEKLKVGNVTAYIGTSAKGPQSVIFAKNNLLILIKSTGKISNDQWTAYISSLQ